MRESIPIGEDGRFAGYASAFGLVVVTSVFQAVGTVLLLLGSGALFYFMIRAMARIQMPSPPGAD